MPELPEVETTCANLARSLTGQTVSRVITRRAGLRWPFNVNFDATMAGLTVVRFSRRAKYILMECKTTQKLHTSDMSRAGILLAHLGMSGVLQIVNSDQPLKPHDHVDIVFSDGRVLRFNDPRRFGALIWIPQSTSRINGPPAHPLLDRLGPEPLDRSADELGEHLKNASMGKTAPIKHFLMDQSVVVGVGNIYASEALFLSGIHPSRAAKRVSHQRYIALALAIQQTLSKAILAGGSSIRDYRGSDGQTGDFQNQTQVYGRANKPCYRCDTPIRLTRHGGRATYFCVNCQR